MKYDTDEIRRIAGRVGALSDSVTAAANGSVRHASDELPTHFRGEAAVELKASIKGLLQDVHACANKMENMREMLLLYANILEKADDQAAAHIGSK